MPRIDHGFPIDGDTCAAWLYRPDGDGPVPCVVLAHGFGMTRDCRLDAWAQRFTAAGFAALVFDYRGFGDSGGRHRQVLDIAAQRADWRAAVAHVRATEGVDPDRVALWGTSFSGGHVLSVAADDPRIAAVVAQVPFVDGPALLRGAGARRGPREPGALAARVRHTARLVAAAVRDELRGRLGRDPLLVPVAGEVGSGAVIAGPGAERAIRHLVPEGVAWRNEVAARIALRVPLDRPGRRASEIGCPLLVAVCDGDTVTPPGPALAVVAAAPRGETVRHAFTHFEAYVGAGFEVLCTQEVEFLSRHLIGPAGTTATPPTARRPPTPPP
ncbi:alpha/beta fold hydrolase [Pseudonocardia abyssalis]|uniref:Alpha/beta fold hydrolase n=1 Tax=Pseudonocardia abyssalis TaxID=2792008 RepID=A0ABS6UL30_9PSEU|nr:alpha/beta hydrolase [Pseudonocardia abyssalis]MBW0119436.1 alpha/beta fold hydrolase [Pseudonocardia abyssalis]MBW0132964.1 alpha/beta fold hydrolase [Pseudonocardia abyssalis]